MDYEEDELEREEDIWSVITAYFDEKGLVRQQLDSFDEFIQNTMQEVVEEAYPIEIYPEPKVSEDHEDYERKKIRVKFGQIYLSQPQITEHDGKVDQMFPNMARMRQLTYCSPLFCDVNKTISLINEDGQELQELQNDTERVFLGRVPIMLRSSYCSLSGQTGKSLTDLGECPYDQGGYFVINGSEKVLIAQERMSSNHVYCFSDPKKGSYVAEIRSMLEGTNRPTSSLYIKYVKSSKGGAISGPVLRVTLPYIRQEIPIIIIFRALGFTSDRDILEHIVYDFEDQQMMELLRPSLEEAFVIQDPEVALDFIGKRGSTLGASRDKRIQYAKQVLQKEVLPHVGVEPGHEVKKAYFFGYMVNLLLSTVLGRREPDDRDHFGNKRMDLAGPLLGHLFRQLFAKLTKETRRYLQKKVEDGKDFTLANAIDENIISRGLKYSLATGNWGDRRRGQAPRTGVSQVLHRLAYASTLSHLRRLNSPIGRDGKLAKPRQLHNTHWGMVCPAETPEGQACGLVKNLSLMAYISVGVNSTAILDFLEEWTMETLEDISPSAVPYATKIFVNGCWVGVHRDPEKLVETVRALRRQNNLPAEVSVVWDVKNRELRLLSDAGRCCRPLFIVEHGRLIIKKSTVRDLLAAKEEGNVNLFTERLVQEGYIEYIDTDEEETAMIAMFPADVRKSRLEPHSAYSTTWTHCEIHPAMIRCLWLRHSLPRSQPVAS